MEASRRILRTVPHWARLLGVSDEALKGAIERGELEAVRLSDKGWWRITESAIADWLQHCTNRKSARTP